MKENSISKVENDLYFTVKHWVNKQAGSWSAAQEWTTNQRLGQQVDTTLDLTTTHKFSPELVARALHVVHGKIVRHGTKVGLDEHLQHVVKAQLPTHHPGVKINEL